MHKNVEDVIGLNVVNISKLPSVNLIDEIYLEEQLIDKILHRD